MARLALAITDGILGQKRETLQLLACRTVEQLDRNDALLARIKTPRTPLRQRQTLRFWGADAVVREYRVRSIVEDPGGAWLDIEGAPVWLDLTDAGLIRDEANEEMVFAFGGQLNTRDWMTSRFLPNLAADGLYWLSDVLGPMDAARVIPLEIARWNRLQLVEALATALDGAEWYLTQASPTSLYQIRIDAERGADRPRFTVAKRKNVVHLARAQSDTELATIATPFGLTASGADEPATIAENAWLAQLVASNWVVLLDPGGGAPGVAFDEMLDALYLEIPNGVGFDRRLILASRASDGAVLLADTSGITSGITLVRVVRDSAGAPLHELANPAAVAQYGRVVRTPPGTETLRGERNWLPNPLFSQGAVGWSATGGYVEPLPTSDVYDLNGVANGAHPAASTVLAVQGFPAFAVIRRGDLLQTSGALLTTTDSNSWTVTSDGKAFFGLATATAFAVLDNAVLVMRENTGTAIIERTIIVDGNHAAGVGAFHLKGFNFATRQMLLGDQFEFRIGGVYSGHPTALVTLQNTTGALIVQTQTIPITPLTTLGLPAVCSLAIGADVALRDPDTGIVYNAIVASTAYVGAATSITLSIAIPDGTDRVLDTRATLTTLQGSSVVVTNTHASQEFAGDGTLTVTWATGLAASQTGSVCHWLDASGVEVAILNIVSGAGAGATSAVLSHPLRSRIFPGTTLTTGGLASETLFAGATVTLDSAGAGTVALAASTTVAIPSLAGLTVYRNIYGWPDVGGSAALRTVGTLTSDPFAVPIRGNVPRTVRCQLTSTLYLPVSNNAYGGVVTVPVELDIVDADTNAVLGLVLSQITPPVVTDARPVPVTFTQTVILTLTKTTRLRFKLYTAACSPVNLVSNVVANGGSVYVSTDDAIPFVHGAFANGLWSAGTRYLAAHDVTTGAFTMTLYDFSALAGAERVAHGVSLGQSVRFRDTADVQRIVRIERNHLFPGKTVLTFARLARTASQLLVR